MAANMFFFFIIALQYALGVAGLWKLFRDDYGVNGCWALIPVLNLCYVTERELGKSKLAVLFLVPYVRYGYLAVLSKKIAERHCSGMSTIKLMGLCIFMTVLPGYGIFALMHGKAVDRYLRSVAAERAQ